MKKTLLFLGALTILGTTAFGATSINSEIRAIDYKDATDKIEYTLAEGSTDIAENLKFYFDVDLDTEYNDSGRDKQWDTDWRLGYTMPEEVAGHKLTVSYEIDYDYNYDTTAATYDGDKDSLAHDLRFEFAKDNYYIAPSYNYDDDKGKGYFQLDFAFSAAGPLGTSVWVESYNYFNKDGLEDFDTDLEIYVKKSIPFYGVNIKPELALEGYNFLTEAKRDVAFYASLRVDKTFDVAEGFAVTPYVAFTDYKGVDSNSTDSEYYEFGIETSVKF